MFGKKPASALQIETLPEDQVHLKPILGIRPGVYLAGLYALILLGIFFFTLLYPGITRPGSLLVLDSEPQGAAVRVDGITLGTTPCELFTAKGTRLVELVLPGFTPVRQERIIPGRVFASWFFPRRIAVFVSLEAPQPLEALISGAVEYTRWSFTGEPTAAYQIPQDLSEAAYRIGPSAASDPSIREEAGEVLKAAARFAVTKAALRDLLRAQFFIDNGGLSPSPLTMTGTAASILNYLSDTPGAAAWLSEALSPVSAAPPESIRLLEGSPWYRQTVSGAAALAKDISEGAAGTQGPPTGETIRLGNLNFQRILAGEFIQGASFPHRVRLESFYIAATELGAEEWERFLSANPRWRRDNSATLIGEGLASPGYLDEPINPPSSNSGVPGISWFAAAAYCEWLTQSLPASLAGWEVRLPREAEWEYAAPLFAVDGGSRFWEWCADPYVPLNYLTASPTMVEAVSSPERSLRGGSWINSPGSVGIETRASLAPALSSPFVSFRPVIALKNSLQAGR
ncbi:SUMF1/EgtB/PvdO family nonheme iron enzyme [Treponema primitia]|uniref:SUMF1/EgtB/PvdO family nonheme iron enzyme n=1 Tax=Treponema primitia TaxID=88058 RepID=UPI0002554F5B|nr:SUMF1/EgtB/PvdO family nonheme iron enzyme [Treponema primitia]